MPTTLPVTRSVFRCRPIFPALRNLANLCTHLFEAEPANLILVRRGGNPWRCEADDHGGSGSMSSGCDPPLLVDD